MMAFLRRMLSFPLVQLVLEIVVLVLCVFIASAILGGVRFGIYADLASKAVFAVATAVTFLVARYAIERTSFRQLGLPNTYIVRDLLLGFVGGAVLISITISIMALAGWYRITSVDPAAGTVLVIGLLTFLFVAFFEEGLFRGIIFRHLESTFGSWIALGLSALFFGITHLLNPGATIVGALAIALEAGVMLAALYMLTRSLWLVIGLHWSWNFFEGTIFGAQVSATNQPSVFHSVTQGPQILTGGAFGPEASLIAVVLCLSVGVVFLLRARKQGQFIEPFWRKSRVQGNVGVSSYTQGK